MANLQDISRFMAEMDHAGSGEGSSRGGSASQQNLSDLDVPRDICHRYDKLHADVRPYAMMTRTCYMEFDPANPRAKLPQIFARFVGPLIGRSLYLQDVNCNQIQVAIEHKKGKVYFTNGWSRLRDFYNIGAMGAWVTLLYVTPFVFHLRLRDTDGIEVLYPKKTPPAQLLLTKPFAEASSDGPVPFFVLPTTFTHRLEKTLASADVETGVLTLLWEGFCQSAFAREETQLTFMDWFGNKWDNCHLQFDRSSPMICKITGQWGEIYSLHRLTEGVTVKFGVTKPSNNQVVYFKLSPFLGVRTCLVSDSTKGKRKVFYRILVAVIVFPYVHLSIL